MPSATGALRGLCALLLVVSLGSVAQGQEQVEGKAGKVIWSPRMGMLTVDGASRPVCAVLSSEKSVHTQRLDFPAKARLADISLYALADGGKAGDVVCKVEFKSDAGRREVLLNKKVSAGARAWFTERLDLSERGDGGHLIVSAASAAGRPFRLFVGLSGLYKPRGPGERNLILLCLDTLRADHMGCYGYSKRKTTPFMDTVAAKGTRFANCQSAAPWTLPSLFALFTGQYPSCNYEGLPGGEGRFNRKAKTLASVFSAHGYNTMAVTAGWEARPERGLGIGFNAYCIGRADGKFPDVYPRAVEWLRQHKEDRFFLFLHTFEIHAPYTRRLFKEKTSTKTELAIQNYDSGIKYADDYVKQLFEELKRLGLEDNTVVAIFGDHGEDFRAPGGKDTSPHGGHGQCLLQTVLHVPFIIAGPGIPQGRIVEDRVSLINMMPTILDEFQLPRPAGVQAKSVKGFLADTPGDAPELTLFAESLHLGPERKAITEGDWKLVYLPRRKGQMDAKERRKRGMGKDPPAWFCALDRIRLYNLSADPSEEVNLFEREPERARRMLKTLKKIAKANHDVRRANDSTFGDYGTPIEEELKGLRTMGYIGGP